MILLLYVLQQEWKKYEDYNIEVDPDQDDKATRIKLGSLKRPHMRAFHMSWWGFFIAFFIWFAISPLLSEIKIDLGLTKQEIWTSSIVSVAGTIAIRLILGPVCDKFGARIPMAVVLCFASVIQTENRKKIMAEIMAEINYHLSHNFSLKASTPFK